MGFLSNLFTEQDMQDSKELRWLLEADDPEIPEEEYEMPDDEGDDQTDNTEQDLPTDTGTDDTEADYEMPDDGDGKQPAEEPPQEEPASQDDPGGENPDEEYEMPEEEPMTDTQAEPTADVQPAEEAPEENFEMPDEEGGGDTSEDQGSGNDDPEMPDDDFNLPDDGGDGGDTGDTEDATQNAGTDDTTMNGPDPDQGLKDAENDIFDGLSDQDKQVKINELKSLYEELYNRITDLLDKINEIPKTEDLSKVYNFVTNNLSDVKQFVYDYMNNMFDNKTYMENLVNYKKYISTLNVINGILEEIRKGEYSAT